MTKRPYEVPGKDYPFPKPEEFLAGLAALRAETLTARESE